MAQRVKLICLGNTLAPYSSYALTQPQLITNSISEELSFDVGQLQACKDTAQIFTPSDITNYPAAMTRVSIKFVQASHFNSAEFFVGQTQDQINNLANA